MEPIGKANTVVANRSSNVETAANRSRSNDSNRLAGEILERCQANVDLKPGASRLCGILKELADAAGRIHKSADSVTMGHSAHQIWLYLANAERCFGTSVELDWTRKLLFYDSCSR